MDMDKSSGGVGIGGLAFVILLVLKIMGEINLSWWIVLTSFIWVPLIVIIGISILIGLFMGIAAIYTAIFE